MLASTWNVGGGAIPSSGAERPSLRDLLHPLSGLTALTDLKAITLDARAADGIEGRVADGSRWKLSATSLLTGDDKLIVTPTDAPTAGRWLRAAGYADIAMPITFATADAAILLTVPAGCTLVPLEFWWTITTPFTGGAASAIGASSSTLAGKTTKGDLLGGATGDVLAALTAVLSPAQGTIGTQFDTLAKRRIIMRPTDTIRFDRITSAFTAGVGAVHMSALILTNNGV